MEEKEITLNAQDLTYNYVGCNNEPLTMGKVNATSTKGEIIAVEEFKKFLQR